MFGRHARLAACRANLDGLGVRDKFRFRWYDRALPEDDCWFEIKWRRNLATGKRRFQVQASGRLLDLPLREWLLSEAQLPATKVEAVLRALEEHWVEDVEALRENLDALQLHLPPGAFGAIKRGFRSSRQLPVGWD